MPKRIIFVHFVVGETDGVSLEIEKRVKIFKQLGADCFFISGRDGLKRKENYLIEELELENPRVKFLRDNLFNGKKISEEAVTEEFDQLKSAVVIKFKKALQRVKPDLIIIHNVFSLPLNLPASVAIDEVLGQENIPTVCLHHDFWFEREKFHRSNYLLGEKYLHDLPPSRSYIIKHQVINSLAQEELFCVRQIQAEKISEYLDFHHPPEKLDEKRTWAIKQELGIGKNDLVILQATRVAARKAIENTIVLVSELEKRLRKMAPLKLGDRVFGQSSRVVLFLPNVVGIDEQDYFQRLKKLADQLKVKVVWAGKRFAEINDFWSSYSVGDLVAYTSIWEGYGNQFLEAIYFKKPIIIFEYPVFRQDIKKEGYQFLSLGWQTKSARDFQLVEQKVIEQVAVKTTELLTDQKKRQKMVTTNFDLGRRFHDQSLLARDLQAVINGLE